MEVHELKNFGCVFNPKPSGMMEMKVGTMVLGEIGPTNVPKFLAKAPFNSRRWKRKKFAAAKERGITDRQYLDGIREVIGNYVLTIDVLGKEKGIDTYTRWGPKTAEMMMEEHYPSSDDLLSCSNPTKALKEYILEFFVAGNRIGGVRYDVVADTDDEFRIAVTDCAFYAITLEAGHPEIYSIGCQGHDVFFSKLVEPLGWEWSREGALCRGHHFCDYHFRRIQGAE